MAANAPVKEQYKDLKKAARMLRVPEENLARAFELEREFHFQITRENDQAIRERLYKDNYESLLALHETMGFQDIGAEANAKAKLVKLFRKELEGKSILDVGCGSGTFLKSVEANLKHKRLVGMDILRSNSWNSPKQPEDIEFIQGNVIDFDIDYKFEVAFSDNVIEHIAPKDLPTHLQSLKNALMQGGKLILISPNRLFGPSDVTVVLDCTNTNRVEAVGTHLNEMSYTEITPILKDYGFSSCKTVVPPPVCEVLFAKCSNIPETYAAS